MSQTLTSPTAATLMLPDRNFIAKVQATSPGPLIHCGSLFQEDPLGSLNPVLDATPLASSKWSDLFAYMHRRFGPPNGNSDITIDDLPSWVLTTPDPRLFLTVCPSIVGVQHAFRPCLVLPADHKPPSSTHELREAVDAMGAIQAFKDAYLTSILDLLRPVAFGIFDITPLGVLEEDSTLSYALEEFDTTSQGYVFIVDPSVASKVAVPSGVLDSNSWPAFHKIIHDLGAGDCGAGFNMAVEQLS